MMKEQITSAQERMIVVYSIVFLLSLCVNAKGITSSNDTEIINQQFEDSKSTLSSMTDEFTHAIHTILPISDTCNTVEGRKRKKAKFNKYVIPLIVGFLLIKSILLPLALKALAVLSGKAVILSLMSLVLAAIVGLKKVASSHDGYTEVHVPTKYRRKDLYDYTGDDGESEPYKYYRERKKKK